MAGIPVQLFSGSVPIASSHVGQLVTTAYAYDEVSFNELAANDTAYNFYKPRAHHQFIITGIMAKADKQVSGSVDAVVEIYEASSVSSTVVEKVLYQDAMVEGDRLSLIGLNIVVREGFFINAKTSDDDIHMNIMGYYIPSHD